jgi:hypothetical protein
VIAYRGPYEYSVPGHETDFTPQNTPPKNPDKTKRDHGNPGHTDSHP